MGNSLRVMSANLWSGAADCDALAGMIEALGVDVLAAQELSADQAGAIAEVLPYGVLEPHTRYHGMGVALRRPGTVDRVASPYRDVRRARLEPDAWPGLSARVEILNVHIAAPHVGPLGSGWYKRRHQLRHLERYLVEGEEQGDAEERGGAGGERPAARRERAPQLLVGDFNSTPVWPVYRRLARHMVDAAVVVAQRRGRPVRRTWGPWSGSPRLLRIDHGFLRGLEIEEFQVLHIPGSDHSALVLDVLPAANADGSTGRPA